MNSVKLFALIVLCFSTFNLFAQNEREADFINKIASNNLFEIKQTAQHYARQGSNGNKVLDVLAEYLWENYKTVTKAELDTYGWICRALSRQPEGRYVDLLTEVDHANVPKKLKKYAYKALKKQEKYRERYARSHANTYPAVYRKGGVNLKTIRAEYIAPKVYTMKPGLTTIQQEKFYLVDNNLVTLKNTARNLYNRAETNTELLDVMAEVLAENYQEAADYQADTFAWVAKTLGNSRDKRYQLILDEVVNSNANKKIRKHAKKALRNLKGSSDSYYVKGQVNLDNVRDEVAQ